MKEKFSAKPSHRSIQSSRQLAQGGEFLPGEILPEQMPRVKKPRPLGFADDLTPDERAEMIADSMLADQIDKERQEIQLKVYGKTDQQIEADADAFLRAAELREQLSRKLNRKRNR